MATEIIMPKMGMGMEEGTVVEWLKHKGEPVKKGESVVSISSDKIEKDLEAPEDGVLIGIEAEEDAVVPIGQALGYIGREGESVRGDTAAPDKEGASSVQTIETKEDRAAVVAEIVGDGVQPRLRVSPAARKLARTEKIDLKTVKGTGPLGRITKADVAAAADEQKNRLPVQPATLIKEKSVTESSAAVPDKGTARKVTGMRKVIAQRMYDSLQQTAQLTLQTTVDVTDLLAFQKTAREAYPIDDEVRLTITDFIAKAVINALLVHKEMNSTYSDNTITTYDGVSLGIAVALAEGLVVPVIQDADKKSLSAISREIRKASRAAREGRLDTLQLTGSTFSITSLGTYGIGFFTPVLNPPEIGILGVGTISEQPAYIGADIQKRSFLPLSLTFDHRAIDGAPAAEFLAAVKANLEAPFTLVL
ncbi:dihydrolipoamide acetyltransferase family protein [Sporolactobacillus putidus]|uniref:Dihydrolipoamide acetyltransferase component of pyruvate dehydrogenase complex n=1 Tax=Sporolactobacillus putidus TaxID=492735 RepID=A0A917VYS5_9BACL|nr:dihydrolipoamide acetyltransferase family protein [Sporolactobacillus putidus]GGL46537.1 dihydrolipoamide acetyltransferase component of pyruvate dehydrogenase complex [Sporolactobacillus putidus]